MFPSQRMDANVSIDQNSQLIFSQVTLPSSLHAEQHIHKNYQTILLTDWKKTYGKCGAMHCYWFLNRKRVYGGSWGSSQHNSSWNSEANQKTSSFSKTQRLPVSQVWTGLLVVRTLSFTSSDGHKSQLDKSPCANKIISLHT